MPEAATPLVAAETVELLAFTSAGERYAFPLTEVQEILTSPAITKVPCVQAAINGILNLRGKVVTVVNLATLLSLPSPGTLEHIIVAPKGNELYGFHVDHVTGVMRIPKTELKPVPEAIAAKAPHRTLDSAVMGDSAKTPGSAEVGSHPITLVLSLQTILSSLTPAAV